MLVRYDLKKAAATLAKSSFQARGATLWRSHNPPKRVTQMLHRTTRIPLARFASAAAKAAALWREGQRDSSLIGGHRRVGGIHVE